MSNIKIDDYSKVIQGIEKELAKDSLEKKEEKSPKGFTEFLKEAIDKVDSAQKEAQKEVQKMVTGEETNIHKTLIAMEKADLSFNLMMQIRNKLMDAYNELMRTQV